MATLVAWLYLDYILNKGTKKGRISLSETRSSSKEILQLVQRQAFSEEIDSSSEARPVNCQSKLANLLRVLTKGTSRVGGVIRHTSKTLEAAHSTLLPNDHPVPSLPWNPGSRRSWTCSFHQTSNARIIQARSLLHHFLRKCIDYRNRNEPPMKQLIADMPKERLTPYDQPFTYMGVDFFRPFYVKRGRGRDEIYGCLFTCLTSRTVHTEDVRSLETDTFIQALLGLISNLEWPKEFWVTMAQTSLEWAKKFATVSVDSVMETLIRSW